MARRRTLKQTIEALPPGEIRQDMARILNYLQSTADSLLWAHQVETAGGTPQTTQTTIATVASTLPIIHGAVERLEAKIKPGHVIPWAGFTGDDVMSPSQAVRRYGLSLDTIEQTAHGYRLAVRDVLSQAEGFIVLKRG